MASPLAVSYRRVRSFSRHFITIQSTSPRTSFDSRAGSVFRAAAILGRSPELESRTLGRGGSSSLISRTISPRAASRSRCFSSGVVPVSSS